MQGTTHRMSLRSPNMWGKESGKAGAACRGHVHAMEGRVGAGRDSNRHAKSSRAPTARPVLGLPTTVLPAPRLPHACRPATRPPAPCAHLHRGESNLADVVVRGEAKDAAHLVHGHAPGRKSVCVGRVGRGNSGRQKAAGRVSDGPGPVKPASKATGGAGTSPCSVQQPCTARRAPHTRVAGTAACTAAPPIPALLSSPPPPSPLDARDVAVEGAAHVLEIRKNEGAAHVEAAGDDVLAVLAGQPPRLLHRQAPAAAAVDGGEGPS